jgi:hypothetical protein
MSLDNFLKPGECANCRCTDGRHYANCKYAPLVPFVEKSAYEALMAEAKKLRDACASICCHAESREDCDGTNAVEIFDKFLEEI